MSRGTEYLAGAMVGAAFAAFIVAAVVTESRRPVMSVVWPTGECVRIEPPEAGSCLLPPVDYRRQWVPANAD